MAMTKEERKKHIRERVHPPKQKALVLFMLLFIVAAFLAGIYYSIAFRMNPEIPILLIIGLFVIVILATFFVDYIFYESI